jgi:trimeric autotransporter adhesin
MKNFTNLKTQFCFLLLMLSAFVTKAQTISQTFNVSGTFPVPAGVTSITVEAWGGGGKGGSRTSGSNGYGGGGGGAYSRSVISVTPGQIFDVTVGAGSTSNATPGEDSEFINQSTSVVLVRAKGGNSVPNNTATGATGGSAAAGIGGPIGIDRFNGGNGANGTAGVNGGGGGAAAGTANNGANGLAAVGGIGTNGGGNGGAGRSGGQGNGLVGTTPGGGGGGALRVTSGSPTGGNGMVGQVIVTYAIPEILVTGNFLSITDGDVTPSLADDTDFGVSPIGVGVTKTYTIQNTSATAALVIGAITFSGVAAADCGSRWKYYVFSDFYS